MSELVKRLRARVVGYEFNDNLSDDAADRIEALEAENARLRQALTYAQSGLALAYDAAEKHLNDEVLLHCGHHEARIDAALKDHP